MSLHVEPPISLTSTPTLRPRQRCLATSQPPLSRTDAFRSLRPDVAFLQTPSPTSISRNTNAPRKTRIPTPVSPSQVNLNSVTDISLLPPTTLPLRRSQRQCTRVFTASSHQRTSRQPSRQSGRPTGEREEEEERRNTAQARAVPIEDRTQPAPT